MAGAAVIVAGFGFRSGARVASLADALEKAIVAGRPRGPVARIAAPGDKAATQVFAAFARGTGIAATGVGEAALRAQPTLTSSAASQAARGSGSVAEAAALAAAGSGARLLAPRTISDDGCATCALAEGEGA